MPLKKFLYFENLLQGPIALRSCSSLNLLLENPCTEENKLTEEAKAQAQGKVLELLKAIEVLGKKYIEELKDSRKCVVKDGPGVEIEEVEENEEELEA